MKLNRTITENISANLLIHLITYVFSFLTVLFAARVLQPEAYGKTTFISSFTGYFVMIPVLFPIQFFPLWSPPTVHCFH